MAGPLFAEDADALPHHRAKQAPDWHVEQLAPGVTRWTMPSGRTHVTTPTTYDSQ